MRAPVDLTWLDASDPFPPTERAWPSDSEAPGLLAAGADLSPARLIDAYTHGIFPWFSQGQPILWFSTDPRMVLRPERFEMHHSLRKRWRKLWREQRLDIRFDHDFVDVMRRCARADRAGQPGTWIGADMVHAYTRLHQMGHAACITAWIDGELAGGLYAVTLGRMVYGESMFTQLSDGSKLALCALVAWARHHRLPMIDCQQETRHLHALGARAIPRRDFLAEMTPLISAPKPNWHFSPIFWEHFAEQDLDPPA
jgi:leucyl/phenylalanyl-tRNA--protein transferase